MVRERSVSSGDVDVAGSTDHWLRYRLPAKFVRRHQHPLCVGQKQRWFLLRLAHEDVRFRFDQTDEPEFDEWRWADYWEPVREVIHFKRPVYRQALHELATVPRVVCLRIYLGSESPSEPVPKLVVRTYAGRRHSPGSARSLGVFAFYVTYEYGRWWRVDRLTTSQREAKPGRQERLESRTANCA